MGKTSSRGVHSRPPLEDTFRSGLEDAVRTLERYPVSYQGSLVWRIPG